MFFAKAIFCRAFQASFRAALPFLPYREPEIIGSCEGLSEVIKKERIRSAMIVTDKGILKNGLTLPLERVLSACGADYIIYDGTCPNPTVENVEEALALYKAHKCDSLIAVGGGSAMDCAKGIGARAVYPKRSLEKMKGVLKVMRTLPTLIAVPTTAGTGSEVTLAAVITDSRSHYKYAIMSFPLIPKYAVLDAAMTYSLPPHLTASTGIDALTHAVEAYIGRSTTAETRRLCLEAVRLIFENIETAFHNGHDKKARENMLLAAYKAGSAFSRSYVGYVHAVAHSLGGRYGTPHGLANAVIMAYVLEQYGRKAHRKLHELGIAAGVCVRDVSHSEGARIFIEAVRELNSRMGIPQKMGGIKLSDIPSLARRAEREANPLYPVPRLMTYRELEGIYCLAADWSLRI